MRSSSQIRIYVGVPILENRVWRCCGARRSLLCYRRASSSARARFCSRNHSWPLLTRWLQSNASCSETVGTQRPYKQKVSGPLGRDGFQKSRLPHLPHLCPTCPTCAPLAPLVAHLPHLPHLRPTCPTCAPLAPTCAPLAPLAPLASLAPLVPHLPHLPRLFYLPRLPHLFPACTLVTALALLVPLPHLCPTSPLLTFLHGNVRFCVGRPCHMKTYVFMWEGRQLGHEWGKWGKWGK